MSPREARKSAADLQQRVEWIRSRMEDRGGCSGMERELRATLNAIEALEFFAEHKGSK